MLRIIVFPWTRIKLGLRVKGKANLKKYKELLCDGFVSVSNHVHPWDYISVMKAIHHIKWPYLLARDKNINGDSGLLVRLVGGIPIPEHDNEATVSFNHTIKKLLNNKGILYIYAEGSMWVYYTPIKPFKNGAASIAIKNDKPVLPMAFSYRRPGWIRRKIFRKTALFTLTIGEPIRANHDLQGSKQINDLIIRVHQSVCSLAGIENNIYTPIYNNSKKTENK